MTDPVRIFIGSSSNNEDAEAEMILKYSLEKNASRPLDITFMRQSDDATSPWGCWATERWSTPFSGFRWTIPEICGFKGRAIYMDVDMINFHDICELHDTLLEEGKVMMARRGVRFGGTEFCVIVFDNAAMYPHSIPIERMRVNPDIHHRMIARFTQSPLVQYFGKEWNCHDGEDLPIDQIKHLHFTNMATQPWKPEWYVGPKESHPRPEIADLWFQMRNEAYAAGRVPIVNPQPFSNYNIIGQ